MPIRIFWALNGQIHRISAEEDMRKLSLLTSSQSKDSAEKHHEELKNHLGVVADQEEIFDQDGWNALKTLAG